MFNRTLLPQTVARQIQEMIQNGSLKPGDKIPPQREFAQKFGISRASLREALLTLETLGMIKTEAGRGTFVTDPNSHTPADMAPWRYSESHTVFDVFQTRMILEGEITALACGRLTAGQLEHMAEATDQMEKGWAAQDLISNVDADLDFHDTIVQACSNSMLRDLYKTVRDQITETQRQPIPITDPERMRASIGEHRRIIKALSDGNANAAREEMQNHIRNTARCAGLKA